MLQNILKLCICRFNSEINILNFTDLINSELLSTEICIDNSVYYIHNLHILDKYINQEKSIVEKELQTKYSDIKFIFTHKTNTNFLYNIGIINVIYDDYNKICEFIGINNKKN